MSHVDDLVAALQTEFAAVPKVILSAAPPARFSPPQVIVTPGDPHLEPGQFAGIIRERWSVLVVVSMADKASGLDEMRRNSLRVRRACGTVGATWEKASGPLVPEGESASQLVLSTNDLYFRYPANEQTP